MSDRRSRAFIKEFGSYLLCSTTKRDEMHLTRMTGFNGSVKKSVGGQHLLVLITKTKIHHDIVYRRT